jgi:hypothetical protein
VEELPFKNLNKSKLAEAQAAGRRPVFKNLKQILKAEEPLSRELPPSVPSCALLTYFAPLSISALQLLLRQLILTTSLTSLRRLSLSFSLTDNSINAPPSLVPARKYCDITGLVVYSPLHLSSPSLALSLGAGRARPRRRFLLQRG